MRSRSVDYTSQVWTLDKDYKPQEGHCTIDNIKIGDEIMFMPSFDERYKRDLLKVYIITEINPSKKGKGMSIILDVKNDVKWTAIGEGELDNYLPFEKVLIHYAEYFI